MNGDSYKMPIVIKNESNNCYLCSLLSIFVSLGINRYIHYIEDDRRLTRYIRELDIDGIKRELNIEGNQDVHQVYMNIMEHFRYTSVWDHICVKHNDNGKEYETSYMSVNEDMTTDDEILEMSDVLVVHFKIPMSLIQDINMFKIIGYKLRALLHYNNNHYYCSVIEDNMYYIVDNDIRHIDLRDMLSQRTYMLFYKKIRT